MHMRAGHPLLCPLTIDVWMYICTYPSAAHIHGVVQVAPIACLLHQALGWELQLYGIQSL